MDLYEDILNAYIGAESVLESIVEPRENVDLTIKNEIDGVSRAIPKKSDYRERFKQGLLRPSDISVQSSRQRIKQFDPSAIDDGAGRMIERQYGYNPWFGEGTQIDF